jgi:hypothetical protein
MGGHGDGARGKRGTGHEKVLAASETGCGAVIFLEHAKLFQNVRKRRA